MSDREEYGVPTTSSTELRNFKRSTVWQDIQREVRIWKEEGIATVLDPRPTGETEEFTQTIGDVRYCQGGLDVIKRLEHLVDALIEVRETYEEELRNA